MQEGRLSYNGLAFTKQVFTAVLHKCHFTYLNLQNKRDLLSSSSLPPLLFSATSTLCTYSHGFSHVDVHPRSYATGVRTDSCTRITATIHKHIYARLRLGHTRNLRKTVACVFFFKSSSPALEGGV